MSEEETKVEDRRTFEHKTSIGWLHILPSDMRVGDVVRAFESTGEAVSGFPCRIIEPLPRLNEDGIYVLTVEPAEVPFTITIMMTGYDTKSMQGLIVAEAAKSLLGQYGKGSGGERTRSLKSLLTDAIVDEAKGLASEHVQRIVEEMLKTEIFQLNKWGEPKDEPQALRDYVIKLAKDYINAPVGSSTGKPVGAHDRNKVARGRYLAEQITLKEIQGLVREVLVDEAKKLKQHVRDVAASAIASMLDQKHKG